MRKTPKIYQNIEQRSEEWYKVRELHLTASNASTIIANGKGLETLCRQKVLEYILPENREGFVSNDMERGILLEPVARKFYEEVTKDKVEEVGFVELSEHIGASPDGMIPEKKKGLEIKCPNDKTFLNYLLDGGYPKDYYNQCQMNMYVSGYDSWDLMFFNPNFKSGMMVYTINKDEETFQKLEEGLASGELIIKNILKQLENYGEQKN